VAQGIGQAITEQVVYDADGQLLSGHHLLSAQPSNLSTSLISMESDAASLEVSMELLNPCSDAILARECLMRRHLERVLNASLVH
jgi:hypothetical protein